MRLDPRFRFSLYAAVAVLFVTGAGWLPANHMKAWPDASEAWQVAGAYLLMVHGGAAMVTLMVLGALVPLHVKRGWQVRRNRLTGSIILASNAVLVVTAFGLYYAGSESLRLSLSDIHIVVGLCLPILFLIHVVTGRRSTHSG